MNGTGINGFTAGVKPGSGGQVLTRRPTPADLAALVAVLESEPDRWQLDAAAVLDRALHDGIDPLLADAINGACGLAVDEGEVRRVD